VRRALFDLLLVAALVVAGAVEVMLGPDEGRLVRALAVPIGTLPLVWRRSLPLLPLATVTLTFVAQAWLGELFDGHPVIPLLVLVVALYSAGRYVAGLPALVVAALAAAALAGTRIAFDSAVDSPPDAALTLVVALLPLLVGRWARGQELLRRELAAKAERLERERRRDARQAAEEERMRIAGDLQTAATGGLETIARETRDVARRLEAGDTASARDTLARIAAGARQALADVRRVLGILRREEPEPVTPPAAPAAAPAGRRRPLPALLLPAALMVGAAIELQLELGGVVAALSAVLIAAPLLVRTRLPLAAAAGVLAAVAFQSLALEPAAFPVSSIVAVICAAYAIGAYAEGGAAVAGLVAFAAGTTLHAVLAHPDAVAPALIGGTIVPWTVGRIRRGQRLLMHEASQRAAEIQRGRERDARAAVTAERMRVARELHDAVAHNISVIAIQAAGAQGVVERDPARAAEVVGLIEAVVGEALVELGRLADDREPQPGLADLDALAQRARDEGLPVELHVEGGPAPLPAGVDLAAFRIVQEALANTSKHAGGASARVVVRYEPRAVALEIEDDGRGPNGSPPRAGSGHGLIGMRERVALYGGTLGVGRRVSGGFTVRARLPLGET
jgi:signal transduction histidine kinase